MYIFWFLHQTTTSKSACPNRRWLYIFWFLHQTTTGRLYSRSSVCCISFDSYIKPQPFGRIIRYLRVVYLLIPTSNHNCNLEMVGLAFVVYLLIPTSNHNSIPVFRNIMLVVYLLIPTSNHNYCPRLFDYYVLYIFWFLHQTTTHCWLWFFLLRCISFDSYIKPQPFYV